MAGNLALCFLISFRSALCCKVSRQGAHARPQCLHQRDQHNARTGKETHYFEKIANAQAAYLLPFRIFSISIAVMSVQ